MYSPLGNNRIEKMLAAVLMLIALVVFLSPSAFAHAKLIRSQPSDGETVPQSPKTIQLTFNERVQQTAMNAVVVTDKSGNQVDKKILALSEDGKNIFAELEELSSGTYQVEWKALSADEHLMKGKFIFTVAAHNKGSVGAITQTLSREVAAPENQTAPAQEAGTSSLQSVVRWLTYLGMMTLFGGFAFLLLVLKPALGRSANLDDEERALIFRQGANRFIRLAWLSLILVLFSAVAALILQTSSALDTSIPEAFAPQFIFRVLTETGYGVPWLLQLSVTLVIFGIVFFTRRNQKDDSVKAELNDELSLLWAGLILSGFLLRTLSLTGHAQAAEAEYPFAVLSDWLHLISAGIWAGGLFHLALTLPKSISGFQNQKRLSVISRVIPRFTRLAVASTILLAATGIYNSWIHLVSIRDLLETSYGLALLFKIILFLPMLALGGFNTFVTRPRADRLIGETDSADEHRKAVRDFYRALKVEAALGIVILLLAAILAFLPPARHHHALINKTEEAAASTIV